MKKIRNRLLLAGLYIVTFGVAFSLTSWLQNGGFSGSGQSAQSTVLPVLYVSYESHVINQMSAYTEEIDCGYLRESISVLDESGQLLIGIFSEDYGISSIRYRISDASNENTVETGSLSQAEDEDTWVLSPANILQDGEEYCLTLTLTGEDESTYYYYTRLMTDSGIDLAGQLSFVWEFNQNTFETEMLETVSAYLPESDDTQEEEEEEEESESYTQIDLDSDADLIMWGDLSPTVEGSISTAVKAVGEDAVTISLLYRIEVEEEGETREFYVSEYYTVSEGDEGWQLEGFERSLEEIFDEGVFEIEEGQLRLGVLSQENLNFVTQETEDGYLIAFSTSEGLWYYDVVNNMMTNVFAVQKEIYDSWQSYAEYGLKALRIEEDGTLYFMVYGYMMEGDHAGETGIAIYAYDPSTNLSEEKAFVSSDRSYELLINDVEKLAFMNEEHQVFFCLNDTVYRYNYTLGQSVEFIEQLEAGSYVLSEDQKFLATANADTVQETDQIKVYNLETGKSTTLSEDGKVLKLLGYFHNDLVYGVADASLIYEDSDGTEIVPMDTIYILDEDLNVAREYSAEGQYILDVEIEDTIINLSLAEKSDESENTYTDVDGDFLVYSGDSDEEEISLGTVSDESMLEEVWIDLSSSSSESTLRQSARFKESSPAAFAEDEDEGSTEKYYLYTGFGLEGEYVNLVDAIEACTDSSSLVVSSDKTIVWRNLEMSGEYLIDFEGVEEGDVISSIVSAICSYAEGTQEVEIDDSMTIMEALSSNLTEHTAVSLRGLSMEQVLYFVYTDRPVIVQEEEGKFDVIIGYDGYYLQIADPSTGLTLDWNYEYYTAVFEEEGNIFISYY